MGKGSVFAEGVKEVKKNKKIHNRSIKTTSLICFKGINIKKFYGPFLWKRFNCLKAAEPLLGDNLRFTNHFFREMKG